MLRTALGPQIAAWLDDESVVEVMLNPDGRLWLDRLTSGLEDAGASPFARGRREDRPPRRASRRRRGARGRAARLGGAAGNRRALRGTAAARRDGADLRHPQARRRRLHARRLRRERHHRQEAGLGPARRRRVAHERARRRRHLDRQDDARQCAARRGRQDLRSRHPDRGHARAAMRRAQSRVAAHQGRRGDALRSRALVAALAPRPHSDRRGARAPRRSTS